jgi:hypothetical protein
MKKQTLLFGISAALVCSIFLLSGCTGQNNTSPETLRTILEKAATLKSMYYELDVSTIIDDSVRQTTTMKIWQQTPYLKEEVDSTSGNITTTQIIIKRPEGIYRYDDTLQTYELDPIVIIPQPSIAEMVKDLLNNQTLTIERTENISGKTTTILQYAPIQSGNSMTMEIWIWNEKGVPLKATSITKSEGITETKEYKYHEYSFEDIPEGVFNIV